LPRRPLRVLTPAALARGLVLVYASVASAKGATPPRKCGRKRNTARTSALTAARALIGHTCMRLWVEHSMDMGVGATMDGRG
jgi:hypothetical protein